MRNIVIFCSHKYNDAIHDRYVKLKGISIDGFDTRFIFNGEKLPDAPAAIKDDMWLVSTEQLSRLPYSDKMEWKKFGVVPGNPDLLLLYFKNQLLQYDFIWFIEHDVHYEGNWSVFFQDFDRNKADLLTAKLRRQSRTSTWMWWPYLKSPASQPIGLALASFNPVMRLSKRAFLALEKAYLEGWKGHFESTVPTILYASGMKIEDFGGRGEFVPKERKNKYYDYFGFRVRKHEDGELVFENGRLYHPIKLDDKQ